MFSVRKTLGLALALAALLGLIQGLVQARTRADTLTTALGAAYDNATAEAGLVVQARATAQQSGRMAQAAMGTATAALALASQVSASATDAASTYATATPMPILEPPTMQPTVSPTSPAGSSSGGKVHICVWAHFDQTHVRCLQDDHTVGLADNSAQLLFPNPMKTSYATTTINTLKQDGTGAWVVVGSQDPSEINFPRASAEAHEPLYAAIQNSNGPPACNDVYRLQLFDFSSNKIWGSTDVKLTCSW